MMEVILRQDVPELGKAGALVRVKPGYARNFLLPRGLAFEATPANRARLAAEQKARSEKAAAELATASAFAARLKDVTVTVTAKAGDEGKLFGSITAADIAAGLERAGHTVDKRKLELAHPIRTLGFHTVGLRLHPAVHAEVRVTVVAE